jgi:hypothetical protein
MSGLILPDVVLHRMALEESLERYSRVQERAKHLRWLEAEMKALDPRLELVKAKDSVDIDSDLKPGYWHIRLRCEDDAPDPAIPWMFPTGEFREPDSGILDFLRSRDLWNRDVFEHATRQQTREEDARRAELEAGRDERVDEMATRIKSIDSPGVLFSDTPWTARTAMKRGGRKR